jgi:rhodanese-related sulfurtransferase
MFARLFGLSSLSPAELHRLMQAGAVTVIDVNSPQSWNEARVPGAQNLDAGSFRERDLPSDKDATLVFYCSNFLCRKAPNAARRAKEMGYRNARIMSAGISGWLGAGLPTDFGVTRG